MAICQCTVRTSIHNTQFLRVGTWCLLGAQVIALEKVFGLSRSRYQELEFLNLLIVGSGASGGVDPVQETENAESFAFALVNGSLGVFELQGRRVRDFR